MAHLITTDLHDSIAISDVIHIDQLVLMPAALVKLHRLLIKACGVQLSCGEEAVADVAELRTVDVESDSGRSCA